MSYPIRDGSTLIRVLSLSELLSHICNNQLLSIENWPESIYVLVIMLRSLLFQVNVGVTYEGDQDISGRPLVIENPQKFLNADLSTSFPILASPTAAASEMPPTSEVVHSIAAEEVTETCVDDKEASRDYGVSDFSVK